MGDAFLPSTIRFAQRVVGWLERRPALYKVVHKLAVRHDRAMGFRQFGKRRERIGGGAALVHAAPLMGQSIAVQD